MMKILHVGNGNLKHQGLRYYDPGKKINNGLTRLGHNVYFLSDRDTARASTFLGSSRFGRGNTNSIFVNTCRNFKPDVIFFGHADIITNEAIMDVKKALPNVKCAQYNYDPIFRPHNINMINTKAPLMDATFITTAGEKLKRFATANNVVAFFPNPIDPSIESVRCYENDQQEYDVFWAMRGLKGSYKGDPRVEIPLYLEQQPEISINYFGFNGKPELFGSDYFETITKARMGLNISVTCTYTPDEVITPEELYLYSSDRISHYMGCGLLTFTTRDNSLDDLFSEDKELIFFSDQEELKDKIIFYKKNDDLRKKIARAGWEKSHTQFNDQIVCQFMLDTIFRTQHSHNYQWPTTLWHN